MTSLADWLLERIAEDEAIANAAETKSWYTDRDKPGWEDSEYMRDSADVVSRDGGDSVDVEFRDGDMRIYDEGGHSWREADHIARHDPARVLAECDAKRRIVDDLELAEISESSPARHYEKAAPYVTDRLRRVLMHLALPYADHPDFREEWRV
jgi:hypothetical protein